jgi:hypothetical protein
MAFVAQLPVAAVSLDQQVQAWLLSPLLILLFWMILMKALLELPLFSIGTLLLAVAFTLLKRLAIPLRTTFQNAPVKVETRHKKEDDGRTHFLRLMPAFIILLGAAPVISQIMRVSPAAATGAYYALQAFTDQKHDEGDPLSIKQRAIVERYSGAYSKTQLLSLDEDERFVASQIAKHKTDRRWLYVQSILQGVVRVYAPEPSQKQISQHFFALWRQLEQEVKARAAEKPSPTPD